MKNLLNENNPFVAALSNLGDLIILNAFFLISSLPIFTIGASITAAFRVALSLHNHSCSSIAKEFIHAFRCNFKQATVIWCISLPLFLLLGLYYLMAISDFGRIMYHWLLLLLIICMLLLAILCYIFPLIGRYQNTLKIHLKNAAILAISNFPKTVLLVVVSLLPIALFACSPGIFFYILPFWILVGFAALIKLSAALFSPISKNLDRLSTM